MTMMGETQRTLRKTCPSATLSTTNPTRTVPGHEQHEQHNA
jgi:hypothetical protein